MKQKHEEVFHSFHVFLRISSPASMEDDDSGVQSNKSHKLPKRGCEEFTISGSNIFRTKDQATTMVTVY